MHDELTMRSLHCVGDSKEQAQTRRHIERMCVAPCRERLSVHEFDDKIRPAVRRNATVEQTRNVRVIESGKNTPFRAEA